jgi:TolB-like protein/Flp pilus assembly protein TadD
MIRVPPRSKSLDSGDLEVLRESCYFSREILKRSLAMTAGPIYRFGPFRLDVGGRLLFRGDKRIPLASKTFDLLAALVESRGQPLSRPALLQRVWRDTAIEEGSLTAHISLLRKALASGAGARQYVETLPKHGYRFVGAVEDGSARESEHAEHRVMLAVLPFENLSGGEKYDYFSDGLTEEMITHLGRWSPPRLGVIARTSSMRYKSTNKSVDQIGRELNVAYVLEGSVRRVGRRVRITAQLIHVSDQAHLWAESYERDMGNLLDVQSSVALAVAKEIRVKLTPDAENQISDVDPEAHEAYWKGRHLWSRRTIGDLLKSIQYFERALAHQPRYAAARSGLADTFLTLADDGHLPPREAMAKARASARKALELNDSLAEAHTSFAHAEFHEFRWSVAEREFQRSIELNGSYAAAHFYYANLLVVLGRFDDAVARARTALHLDPVSPATGTNLAGIYNNARRHAEAAEQARRVLETDPHFARALEELGKAAELLGQPAEAVRALRKAVERSQRNPHFVASLAHGYAIAGDVGKARQLLQELRRASRKRYVSPYTIALVLAALGQRDESFRWLETAYEDRSSALPFLGVNPRLRPLHTDPRFRKLLRRMKLSTIP